MSLSARFAVEPSRRIAWAQCGVPLAGLVVAVATLAPHWTSDRAVLAVAACAIASLFVATGLRRSRAARLTCRFTVSDRRELDVLAPAMAIDGTCRLAESTVVWNGFWIVALRPDGDRRVRRLVFEPATLAPDARRALARFLIWSTRERGGRAPGTEKSAG